MESKKLENMYPEIPSYTGLGMGMRELRSALDRIPKSPVVTQDENRVMVLNGIPFAPLKGDRLRCIALQQEITKHHEECKNRAYSGIEALENDRFREIIDRIDRGEIRVGSVIRAHNMAGSGMQTGYIVKITREPILLHGRVVEGGETTKSPFQADIMGPIEILRSDDVKVAVNLTDRIRSMSQGDVIEIIDHPIQSVRVTAARVGASYTRSFSVTATSIGCKVARMDGVPSGQIKDFELAPKGAPRNPDSLASMLRDMEIGSAMEFGSDEFKQSAVRQSAYAIGSDLARKYRVNRTDDGCRVTRLE